MAYMVMAYVVMAYVVMAYVVMAYVVMVYVVMAGQVPLVRVVRARSSRVWGTPQIRQGNARAITI